MGLGAMEPGATAGCDHRGCVRPGRERLVTPPTLVTFVRTGLALALALLAAGHGNEDLLWWSLAVYWVGDIVDGTWARWTDRETRSGAVFDILGDRLSAGAFYTGLVWLNPDLMLPVTVYLAEFVVVDAFLSLSFLAWPITSPNYFHLVDRRIWVLNWSKPAKAVNSAAFALLLVSTGTPWPATLVALGLLALKVGSVVRLATLDLPTPTGCAAGSAIRA